MLQKFSIFGLLLSFSLSVVAQDWIKITESDGNRYDGKAGTREFSTNRAGKQIITAFGRTYAKSDKKYDFVRWYVTVEDCKAGYGKLVTLKMNGDFWFDNDFVENGGTVGSRVAEILCYPVKEEQSKGV